MKYILPPILLNIALLVCSPKISAQCTGWNITAVNIEPSQCIANGSFTIQLSGNDVPNLGNIQYSIPLTPTGFSVAANNSPDFANIPPGTFTVKAEATCNGNTVSKTTTVNVGGTYVPPILQTEQYRATLNCGNYGQILALMSGSSHPYTLKVISHPASYTGQLSLIANNLQLIVLDSLPAGTYTLQAIDTCGTATVPQSITIGTISASTLPFSQGHYTKDGTGCNNLKIYKPLVGLTSNPLFMGYASADSIFEVALSIDGGMTVTPFEKMDHTPFSVSFPAGKTIKNMMGANYIFYVKPPCGPVFTLTRTFGAQINLTHNTIPTCNAGFKAVINLLGFMCYPVTISLKNTTTNTNYGPYVYNGGSITTGVLPYDIYSLTYTTADGYTGSIPIIANAPPANPYSVKPMIDNQGLNGYVGGFGFSRSVGDFYNGTIIKLISGPPGYAYADTIWGTPKTYPAWGNMAPLVNNNKYFKQGTYVWEIRDSCGTYTLTSQVQQSDFYNYTLDLSNRQQTCLGLNVYPSGSFTIGQFSGSASTFKILEGPAGYVGKTVSAGDAFVLSDSGTYIIGVSASIKYVSAYDTSLPNPYQVTDTIVYDHKPLTVDVNNTQGFLCIGASAGQGQIGIKGTGGAPFKSPATHYKYYLAAQGNGVSGPYLSNNTTGYFSGMGMNAGNIYDLKIVDSCGAFVTHQVKILDLSTVQLAGAADNEICAGDILSLFALPLPAASYSWTGPNNFSSNQQNPVINNVSTAAAGKYTVSITTAYCTMPATSSVNVIVHPVPTKAAVSVQCIDTVAVLTASQVQGVNYQWYKDGVALGGEADTLYRVTQPGIYVVRTIFPATGCFTPSDPIVFTAPPGTVDTPAVIASKGYLCQYDTVTLSAQTKYASASYQWYKDGVPLAGAANATYNTSIPGNYSVKTSTGPCAHPVSTAFLLEERIAPASIKVLGDTVFCEGKKVSLLGNSWGTGLSYTWKNNGNIIPQASGSILEVNESGTYTLEVFNGYCTTVSDPVHITVNPRPVADIAPGGDLPICEGAYAQLVTPEGMDFYYTWLKDGAVIAGETKNSYTTSLPGKYMVVVGNGKCPDDTSSVNVFVVPYPSADLNINGPVEFCQGQTTFLSVLFQPGCTYQWYRNNEVIPSANKTEYNVSISGRYRVDVANHHCITASEEVNITVHPAPEPHISRIDQKLRTQAFESYQWYREGIATGETGQHAEITMPGQYTVVVTDNNGCEGSDTIDIISVEEGCIVRVPSAFSPNGDGLNDVFRLIGLREYDLKEFKLVNRWGQVVFTTTDGMQGWNGTFDNIPQDAGSYFYMIRYQCHNESTERSKKGDVTLIR